jgi:tRNA threonylcarbamoyl adenosine modification protein YeaZ
MILLIDPATDPARLALLSDGKPAAERTVTERRQQSAELLSLIDELLAEANLAPADLQAIAVVRGPGSFTSLRVGLAVANALAQATSVPMIGLIAEDGLTLEELSGKIAQQFQAGQTEARVLPEYGKPPTITPPAGRSD